MCTNRNVHIQLRLYPLHVDIIGDSYAQEFPSSIYAVLESVRLGIQSDQIQAKVIRPNQRLKPGESTWKVSGGLFQT